MGNYLIEFRLQGYAKKYLEKLIYEVSRKFKVRGKTKGKVVPHVMLFGPFTSSNEKEIVHTFLKVVRKYDLITFKLHGFGNFDNRVIFVDITPSKELIELRRNLAEELTSLRYLLLFKKVKTIGIGDYDKDYSFHTTIAFNDIEIKFGKIFSYLKDKKTPEIKQRLLRLSLIRNGKILYEYDFLHKKLLNRREATNREIYRQTVEKLREIR